MDPELEQPHIAPSAEAGVCAFRGVVAVCCFGFLRGYTSRTPDRKAT